LDSAKDADTSGVFRIATLGGPVIQLADDARGGDSRMKSVTVSPDGKQIAYIAQTASESLIVAVDPDGSNRHVLAKRPAGSFFCFIEWSPALDSLAAVAVGNGSMGLVRVELTTGLVRELSVSGWGAIGQPAWSPDGATIFAPATPLGGSIMQIWAFDARSGDHRPLTSSSMSYEQWSLSATASGDLIANTRAADTTLWATDRSGQLQAYEAKDQPTWPGWVTGL